MHLQTVCNFCWIFGYVLFFLMTFVAYILNQSNVLVEGHCLISDSPIPSRCAVIGEARDSSWILGLSFMMLCRDICLLILIYSTLRYPLGSAARADNRGRQRCPKGVSALGIHGVSTSSCCGGCRWFDHGNPNEGGVYNLRLYRRKLYPSYICSRVVFERVL